MVTTAEFDLFTLVIWLIVLYGFISPFLKKKPPQDSQGGPSLPKQSPEQKPLPSSEDLLRELEGLFRKPVRNERKEPQGTQTVYRETSTTLPHYESEKTSDDYQTAWNTDYDIAESMDSYSTTDSLSSYDRDQQMFAKQQEMMARYNSISDEDSFSVSKADFSVYERKVVRTTAGSRRFNALLRNPATLKDTLIFTEVLKAKHGLGGS